MPGLRGLMTVVFLFVSLPVWGSADIPRLMKKCGPSVSDGFWGAFGRRRILNNTLSFYDGRFFFGTKFGAVREFTPPCGPVRTVFRSKGGITSAVFADKNMLCAGDNTGYVFCADRSTGAEKWRVELNGEVRALPAVLGGMLFVLTTENKVYALDAETGKWLWEYDRDMPDDVTVLGTGSPVPGPGAALFVGFADGALVSLNRHDGSMLWMRVLGKGGPMGDVDTTPVLLNDGDLLAGAFRGSLFRLSSERGSAVWRAPVESLKSPAVSYENSEVYVGSSDGALVVVNLKSGDILSKVVVDEGTPLLKPAVGKKYMLVASAGGKLFLFDNRGRRLLWTYRTASTLNSGPVNPGGEDVFYILSSRGELFCLAEQ